jgi:hypothetical protein
MIVTVVLDLIATALGDCIVKIAASPRMRGPTTNFDGTNSDGTNSDGTSSDGQYLLCMRGPEYREVGIVVYRQSVAVHTRPVFWINLEGGEQAAVVATGDGIARQDMPADFMASDYLKRHGEDCSIRFVALNPRRTLRVNEHGVIVADSAFLQSHPVTTNMQARALFRFAASTDTIEVLALTVHQARDGAEAAMLLARLERLLDESAPSGS